MLYGWLALILWAGFWACCLPDALAGTVDRAILAKAFPDGQFVMGMIGGGWFYPLIIFAFKKLVRRRQSRLTEIPAHTSHP